MLLTFCVPEDTNKKANFLIQLRLHFKNTSQQCKMKIL